mgnify:CR=1 FL=1
MAPPLRSDPPAGHLCPWWLAYTFDNPLRKLVHNPRKILAPWVKEGMTAVDVGCGMGFFSIGMARMVGDSGRVLAVDLQQQMLDITCKRAERTGVAHRITAHRCESQRLGVNQPADFILAFWMVHETPDAGNFFSQLRACLRPSGKILVAEPRMHVSKTTFENTMNAAEAVGLQLTGKPRIRFSLTALFERS